MIFDEFYSNHIWLNEDKPAMVSAAEYVEDVDKDPASSQMASLKLAVSGLASWLGRGTEKCRQRSVIMP